MKITSAAELESPTGAYEWKPDVAEAAGAALILSALRNIVGTAEPGTTSKELIKIWSLDRKLADIMAECGFDERTTLSAIREFVDLFPLADPVKPAPKNPLETAIGAALTDERIRATMGIHSWDGVDWFNKEAAEGFAETAILGAFLAGISAKDKDTKVLTQARKTIRKIIADSEYRVEKIPVPMKKAGKDPMEANRGADEKTAEPKEEPGASLKKTPPTKNPPEGKLGKK